MTEDDESKKIEQNDHIDLILQCPVINKIATGEGIVAMLSLIADAFLNSGYSYETMKEAVLRSLESIRVAYEAQTEKKVKESANNQG